MTRCVSVLLVLLSLALMLMSACSKETTEDPFRYPFISPLHLKRETDQPYSEYRAFYVLTEDFEPSVESVSDLDRIRGVLRFASELSSRYGVPWTHFVDVNALAPAFISDDPQLKQASMEMIRDLAAMTEAGDDCELHMHGSLNRRVIEYMRAEEKLHIKESGAEEAQSYRQRKSFFYNSFYSGGYRELVASLTYGKRLLERFVYDQKKQILAFRPGGWDHGSTQQDTLIYFHALSNAGLLVNSGLSTGDFGGKNWRIGSDPGRNLATVSAGAAKLFEVSPTAGPGGYVNPVIPADLRKLATSLKDEMPVIVSVYHLGVLQPMKGEVDDERVRLDQHFKTVSDLTKEKVIYPVTLRDLFEIISRQQ